MRNASHLNDPTSNCRAAAKGFGHIQWLGADDVAMSVTIDLFDLGGDIIGVEVQKNGPSDDNLFGYWPMTPASWEGAKPGEYETDDVHTSLASLCKDYKLPLDLVVDRMAIAFLRLAQNAAAKAAA